MRRNICVLVDRPRPGAIAEGKILHGMDYSLIEGKFTKAGLSMEHVSLAALSLPETLAHLDTADIILALDEAPLQFTTGKRSIWKWHLSPLDGANGRKVVPSFHPDQIRKEWKLNFYLELAIKRVAKNAVPGPWVRKAERYLLNPGVDETIATLESILHHEWHSIDIETGANQINTFGVAWSPNDAIAIKTLPGGMPPLAFHKIWSLINKLCGSDSKKIAQNGIYERMYLSRYGIKLNNFAHDTMCAMRMLYPELEKGLDNVGRIYTEEPYWKDDGKVSTEEGAKKDWVNIKDWPRHFDYNCKDSSNTFIAAFNQLNDLKQRGLLELHESYASRLHDCVEEMSVRGLPICDETRNRLVSEYESKSASLVAGLSKPINPRSSKAKLNLLRAKGYKLPTKRSTGKESADELSLKKLRLKHPSDDDLRRLLEVAGIEKALSSYLRVRTLDDKRIRYMLDPFATETGRMACRKDPWDGGFNAQTMTDYVKSMIEWVDPDRVFIEIDLSQAESRFVAYDSCEETLLGMLERKEDIHRYVAAEIYVKPMTAITHDERQLGKKSGHGANYDMGVSTFMDSCLKEMDLVLDRRTATRALDSYHRVFPKIREWHKRIRETVYRERKLVNPLGLERYFYGRMNDDTYREAYAYKPQSTIPMIVNHLMLSLRDQRLEGKLDFWFHNQCHDSLLLSCHKDRIHGIVDHAKKLELWHPEVILPAGKLLIPTDVKWGRCLGDVVKYGT